MRLTEIDKSVIDVWHQEGLDQKTLEVADEKVFSLQGRRATEGFEFTDIIRYIHAKFIQLFYDVNSIKNSIEKDEIGPKELRFFNDKTLIHLKQAGLKLSSEQTTTAVLRAASVTTSILLATLQIPQQVEQTAPSETSDEKAFEQLTYAEKIKKLSSEIRCMDSFSSPTLFVQTYSTRIRRLAHLKEQISSREYISLLCTLGIKILRNIYLMTDQQIEQNLQALQDLLRDLKTQFEGKFTGIHKAFLPELQGIAKKFAALDLQKKVEKDFRSIVEPLEKLPIRLEMSQQGANFRVSTSLLE